MLFLICTAVSTEYVTAMIFLHVLFAIFISYVVLYLFTVHIRCTEVLLILYSACLQRLEGPETQRTNFFALVHEHTLTY